MTGQQDRPLDDHPSHPRRPAPGHRLGEATVNTRPHSPVQLGHALRTLEETRLRLVRPDDTPVMRVSPVVAGQSSLAKNSSTRTIASFGAPITDPTDPRWVLAVRTAAELEGTILRPERRERLLALAKRLKLSPFDGNLIIAIIQDQARRGYAPEYCPTAGEPQLRMIPRRALEEDERRAKAIRTATLIAALLAVEILFLAWLLG